MYFLADFRRFLPKIGCVSVIKASFVLHSPCQYINVFCLKMD